MESSKAAIDKSTSKSRASKPTTVETAHSAAETAHSTAETAHPAVKAPASTLSYRRYNKKAADEEEMN
jgi:hypothetical protein